MDGKVVYEGKSKKGSDFLIRYPTMDDLQALTDYINVLSREQTFITFQGETIELEEERKFLEDKIKRINEKLSVFLLVFEKDRLIAVSGVDLKDKTSAHEGVFGISVAKDFRGEGVGKKLVESVLKEAEKLPKLKIITLAVFGNNLLAYKIYQKFGFKESGRIPKGILHRGQYVDHIFMYKEFWG